MSDFVGCVLGQGIHFNILLLVGLAVFLGTVGARLFQVIRVPKIVGYVVIGIILGPVLNVIPSKTIAHLEPFNTFALGVVGFLIGGELKKNIFVKFGKQVFAILLFEGLFAFALVGGLTFLITVYFTNWQTALAVGVVFGAICAATDPASTVNVLWEYKSRGPITTMLTAIVALDDALAVIEALVLYIISITAAGILTGHQDGSIFNTILFACNEIFGSIALGAAVGFFMRWLIKKIEDEERMLIFTFGTIILTIGLAATLHMDVILSTMAAGVVLVNLEPRRSGRNFDIVHKFSPPIYVLFFVLIGARLNVSSLSLLVWLLTAAYIIGSIIGKTKGAQVGAGYSKAVPTIRKYMGFCLYQQGTIAIALLVMASARFEGEIKDTMLSVIVIGVFVLQLVGPLCTKIGIKKGGEAGLNITEDDLIKSYTVADVMDSKVPVIQAALPLSVVIKAVSETSSFYYSVVDRNNKIIGAITLDGIRNTFTTQELNDWLIAMDIMEPTIGKITPDMPLADALELTRKLDVEQIPVVVSKQEDVFVAVLDCPAVRRSLSADVLAKQQQADSMYGVKL